MSWKSALVLIAISFLVGCGPAPSDNTVHQTAIPATPSTPSSLAVDVGFGETTFHSLVDGAGVKVTRGGQGGYHVWTAVRVHDTSVESVQVILTIEEASGRVSSRSAWAGPTTTPIDDPHAMDLAGLRAYVDSPGTEDGQDVVLTAVVVASDGRHGEARHRIQLH